ncbi:DUF1127 domain-containing protein [Roseobacteraceae bacterium NS-SX3]
MAHVISTPNTGVSLAARIRRFAEGVKTAWDMRAEYKRTFNELNALTNRELADIGVRRCDIADIARIHVYGN